jgi:menaquinone-dependent protoporphyrinogen oxidase
MYKILIAYTTNAGSTGEVAEVIGETLAQDGTQVDVRQIKDVNDVSAYDAVLVGGPMILGWHKEAVQFVEAHQRDLGQKPVAYFLTALSLTTSPETDWDAVPVYLDPSLAKPPKNGHKLSRMEKFTTVATYLEPALTKAPQVKPVSAGFFAGKLDYGRLNIFQKLFVRIIIRGEEGDFRDWNAIRAWADEVHQALLGT